MTDLHYAGSELDLFSEAKRWKAYWASVLGPYVGTCVLDVGAGIGATALNLRRASYKRWLGLEPDLSLANRIREAVARKELPSYIETRAGTSASLETGESFDTILYIDVLEHIENDRAELATVARHLTPSGRIIVLSPAHQGLYSPFDRQIGHYRRYDRKTLMGLRPEGTSVVMSRYLDSVGMLASLANRMLLKSSMPTKAQISVWDSFMVPASQVVDRLLLGTVGKTIVCVYERHV